MKQLCKRSLALLMVLVMLIGLLPSITFQTEAADQYIRNWGKREEVATELSDMAVDWYQDQNTSYEELSQLSGASSTGSVPSSALYKELQDIMQSAHDNTTSYDGTTGMYQYTDCENNGSKISSFYSGKLIGPSWDSGKTWNREHTWPKSKCNNGSAKSDIIMLRPTSVSENSSRGNTAYGESSGYYHPNSESGGKYDLRGDCARIVLYVYVRWGETQMWGSGGVMESKEVLLEWMEEDPVDTWELGRNDVVENITGTRNVFVDYPELGFKLFNASIPADYQSPSGGGNTTSYTITATSNNTAYGTVSLSGKTITATPKTGYIAKDYTVTKGTATVTRNGNIFTVNAQSDCTVRINFEANKSVTVSFAGADVASQNGYSGEAMELPPVTAPEGYTFLGWMESPLNADTTTKPTGYYTTSFIPTASTTLYALYSYVDENSTGGGTGNYVKVTSAPADWSGEYVIVNEDKGVIMDGSLSSFDKSDNVKTVTITNHTISAAAGDPYRFVIAKYSDGYSIQGVSKMYVGAANAKNSLDTSTTQVVNKLSLDSSGNAVIKGTGGFVLRYNSGDNRFRYYNNSQSVIALYVKDGSAGTTYYTGNPTKCEHTNTTNKPAQNATCTASGYTAGVYCNDCENYISGHDVVAALGHNWDSGTVTKPAGCTTTGVKTYTCERCKTTKTETIAAAGHSWGDWETTKQPTCTVAGVQTKTCSVCKATETKSISATGHNYVLSGKTYTCTACGDSYDTWFISFSVPAGVTAVGEEEYTEGGVTLPSAGVPTGEYTYTFAGWTTAPVTDTEQAPEIYLAGQKFTATKDTTLYAVYTYAVGGSGVSEYVLTDIANISATDSVVITMSKDGNTYALPNNQSSTPQAKTVTVSGDKLVGMPGDELLWNVSGDASGYIFSVYNTENSYLYCINDSKGVRIGNTASNTLVIEQGYLKHIGAGRFIGVYGGASWRCYTSTSVNIGGQTLGFYVKGETGTLYYTTLTACEHNDESSVEILPTLTQQGYTELYCADCGEFLANEDYVSGVNVKWSPTLQADLTVNFQISVHQALQEDVQEFTLTFDGKTQSYPITDGSCTASVKVAAAQMADEITLEFTDGEETLTKTYTVQDYAKYIFDKDYDAQTKAMVTAMLNYGGAAQAYFGHNTENLVSTSFGESEVPSSTTAMNVNVTAENIRFYGASLVYREKIAVRFYFTGNAEGMTFTANGKTYTAQETSGLWCVEVSDILPQDLGQQIKLTADGVSVAYGPMNYIVRMNQKGDKDLQNLMKALYNYYLTAAEFAGRE